MQLVAKLGLGQSAQTKFSSVISKVVQTKLFRITSYVLLTLFVASLFAMLNNAMAIEESSLGTDLNATGGTAGDVSTASMVLGAPVNWLLTFMNGTGGLLAAMLGLLLTLYSAFVAKSLVGAILSVGIALVALYGPKVLMAFFGATI